MAIQAEPGPEERFRPQSWAKNPHLQSIFGSLKIRALMRNPMLECSREVLLDGGDGVRLLGYHSRHPEEGHPPLVLLIHGWEGSSDSTYILSTGRYLFSKGCDIFRLNLRDHGESHHLNEGLFHGALIDETVQAVRDAARLARGSLYIVGFSLGGNFALRIALKASRSDIASLKEVFCISPCLDPHQATLSIDASLLFYRRYFLNKWKRSLMKKQVFFPQRYDFTEALKLPSCMAVTEAVMVYYPDFPTYLDYFSRYTLTGDALAGLSVPVTIIASEDDPIIPVQDIRGLKTNGFLTIRIQSHGGHCGFLDPFPFGCWYEGLIHGLIMKNEGRRP